MRRLIFLLLSLIFCRHSSLPVRFCREEVAITVHSGSVEVLGKYHIKSRAKNRITVQFFYPFPIDSTHPFPDSIAVPDKEFTSADSGVLFQMRFDPGKEDSFSVYYRQEIKENSCRYIVTTTRRWQEPIERAYFTITVPAEFKGVNFSFKPDSIQKGDTATTYFLTFWRFYPEKDIVITWRE
ncbi:MAG: hypothetical protein ABIK49_04580 [candidate division WOR-3 bacterium]